MRTRWSTVLAVAVLAVASAFPASAGNQGGLAAQSDYQMKVMVRGAPIHGANGLATDADGRVLVASAFGGEIVVLDGRTGQIVDRLGHDVGVNDPDDVAVASDGAIYWTNLGVGEVGRLDPDGTFTKQFVGVGVNPVAFSADGRLFVAQAFFGDGLYELDPLLVAPPRVVIPDSGAGGPNQLNGFDFGPDGYLYAPQPFQKRVVRIDPDSGAMTTVSEELPLFPSSVEFDPSGHHLYATLAFRAVIEIDTESGTFETVADIEDATLDNMTFDARGSMFVSDSHNGAIYRVAPGGGVQTLSPRGMILPGGVAVTQNTSGRESLFVADLWRLHELDARSGRVLSMAVGDITGVGLGTPFTVAADGDHLILTSWFANAVQIWDPATGTAVETFHDFAAPINAIRFQGDLVVAQLGTGSVVRRTPGGVTSTIAAPLVYPSGLAATDDDLWAADWVTGTVWQVVDDGAVLDPLRMVADGLQFPEGMAIDRDGTLLVVEAAAPNAGRLTRIDPMTGETSTVADNLETGGPGPTGMMPTHGFSSVAVSTTGTLYVTGDLGSVVYRLQPIRGSR